MKKPIPFGKYYLLERINVGGMAEVFKAKSYGIEGFEKIVAVKRILPNIAEDEEFVQMFLDEAKIAVQLTHANIAQVYDLGRVGDSYYIAMEYINGKDLRAIFDRAKKLGEKIPIPMACYIIMKVCEGLDYAHNKKDATGKDLNLVHRDVSPQNILISYEGEVKIIDFGIAKVANKLSKTQAGILKGKFGYMSPEQVRGLPLDRRSDIFSVGIVLYELVSGERLFYGENEISILEKVKNVEIIPPTTYNPEIPEELENIILKALAKDLEERYQTAMELHDDLQSFLYTTGSFFGRKDLAAYMKKLFPEEAKLALSEEPKEDAKVASDSKVDLQESKERLFRAPRRPTAPPPPPKPKVTPPSLPPKPPSRPTPPPLKLEAKRTMLGMPQVAPGAESIPSDLLEGKVVEPQKPTTEPSTSIEWDDEELETQVYDKPSDILDMGVEVKESLQPTTNEPIIESGKEFPPPSIAGPPKQQSVPIIEETKEEIEMTKREVIIAPEAVSPPKTTAQKGLNPLLVGGISALVVLVLVGIFYLMGTMKKTGKVLFTVVPPDAKALLKINGKDVPLENGIYKGELMPGEYRFVVEAEGFRREEGKLKIIPGEAIAHIVKLQKLETGISKPTIGEVKTGISIKVEPEGSSIRIDGKLLEEKTPLQFYQLNAGEHEVEIFKEGYVTYKEKVNIKEGETFLLEQRLEPSEIKVMVKLTPEDARCVVVQGKKEFVVTAGEAKILPAIPAKLQCTRRGYKGIEKELPLSEITGNILNVEVELEKEERVATLPTPRPKPPTTPPPPQQIPTPPQPPTQEGTGYLSINTTPWTTVYVDGQRIKDTPIINLPLPSGVHRIRCVNPGFNIDREFTVQIQPGQNTKIIKNLITGQ